MTPKMRQDFESRWPGLARRIDVVLQRRGLTESERDDIAQETALRLIQMWDRVDITRAQVLAATIALNLMRDDARRKRPDPLADMADIHEPVDVETAGLARLELRRVSVAMSHLSPAQRSALLREVGDGTACSTTNAGEKMLRLRARKKLRAALGRISAPVLLRLRKAGDMMHMAGIGGQESLAQGFGWIGCLLIGLMVAVPVGTSGTARAAGPEVHADAFASTVRLQQPHANPAVDRPAVSRAATVRRAKNVAVPTTNGDRHRRGSSGHLPKGSSGDPESTTPAPQTVVGAPELPIAQPDTGVDPGAVTGAVPAEAPKPGTPQPSLPDLPKLPGIDNPAAGLEPPG